MPRGIRLCYRHHLSRERRRRRERRRIFAEVDKLLTEIERHEAYLVQEGLFQGPTSEPTELAEFLNELSQPDLNIARALVTEQDINDLLTVVESSENLPI